MIGVVREEHPAEGRQACWYWRSDADGVATCGPTSRLLPQWTRPGAIPVETLGRQTATTEEGFADGVGNGPLDRIPRPDATLAQAPKVNVNGHAFGNVGCLSGRAM